MRWRIPVWCFFLLFATAATAQTASPFIIDRDRADRAQPQAAPPATPPTPPAPVTLLATVQPFTLTSVTIQGTSLPPDILGAAVKPFIGRTMDAAALTAVATAVSDAYGHAGDIALYTVTVPAQDFSGGVLRLGVTEGFVEHVDLAGDTKGDLTLVTAYAQKLTLEKPLRRSTLQRQLSLMRDVPGLTLDAKFLTGAAPGGVHLLITLTQKNQQFKLSINDAGASLLGRTQGELDASFYNLLREGEETKLSFGTSTIFSRYQYVSLSDSEALDQDGTTGQVALGYLRTHIGPLALSGSARSFQLLVSHPLLRSFDENLSIGGDFDGLDSNNALLGDTIANEKVRALRLSANYSLSDPDWLLALSASLSQGLNGLGARVSVPGLGDPGFDKFVFGASYNHLLGSDWVIRLRMASQMAFAPLPVSELYALGGPDFGRAFLIDSALGDSALAGSAELAWQPKGLPGFLNGSELFTFGDDGGTWYRARLLTSGTTPAQDDSLASGGFGFRVPMGANTRLEVEGADALAANAPGIRAGLWRLLVGFTSTL